MESGKLTIMSILQALMRGCLGRDFVGKQSKAPSVFAISSLLQNLTLCQKSYISFKEYATRNKN